MSDSNRDKPAEGADADEDLDFDREVASARAAASPPVFTQEEAGLRSRLGWGRSPIIAVAVIVVGLFLLVATWADFVYFLRVFQSEPRALGSVEDIYRDGEFVENFDNEWVVLDGEPDVQHAARTPSRDGWYGVLRLLRAEGKLFVAIPRDDEDAPAEFPGHHEGRMRRLGATPQWEKLQQFFDAEQVIDLQDLDAGSVLAAIEQGSRSVESAEGVALELGDDDMVRLVVDFPVGVVQLGRSTWKTREAAEQAVIGLGLAWAPLDKKSSSVAWQFVVGLDEQAGLQQAEQARYDAIGKQLEAGLDAASKADVEANRADPKKGALVMPRRVTYLARFAELALAKGVVSIPYDQDSPEDTGWREVEGRLEAIAPVEGSLAVPRSQIEAVRLERALRTDPDGYLIMVGQHPRDAWPSAVMFVGVLGVMALNVWALVAVLRRRRAEAEP
ncbi:hypothetical protein ACNOYE_07125 [Nannocystaceae bacterium ST9]